MNRRKRKDQPVQVSRNPYAKPVTVTRSPYEGVRAGSQRSSSPYQAGKDLRAAGYVERRDINGNLRWTHSKTGQPPPAAGSGKAMPDAKKGADAPNLVQRMDINGNYRMVNPETGLQANGIPLNPPRFPMKPQAGRQAKAAAPENYVGQPEDPMAGHGTDVPDLSRIGTGDLPTNAELDAGDGLTRALTPEETSRVASFGLGDTSTPSIADEGRTLLDAYTDENGVTHGHAATRDEIDQLNKKEADLQHQAKLADEFNAYKKVTDKQEAGLSETQKAARDLEKPGVAEADREKAKAETNIDLLQMEDRLQKQRDEAEIAQIMADPSEHPATEDDQRLQNPVDRMRAATQRQTDRQQNRDRQELSSALTGAEIAGSAATGYLNGDLTETSFQQEAAKETEGANVAQVANDTLGTLGIGSETGEGSLTDSDVAKVNSETDTLSGMQNLDQMTAQFVPQDSVQTEDEKEDQAAAKGGDGDRFATSRNFLATDKVPDTIFGYPVVSRGEDYTQADIAFFEKHPEAGGYYDLGEGQDDDMERQGAENAGTAREGLKELVERARKDLTGRVKSGASEDTIMDVYNRDYRLPLRLHAGRAVVSDGDHRIFARVLAGLSSSEDGEMQYYYGKDAPKIKRSVIERRIAARERANPGAFALLGDRARTFFTPKTLSNVDVQPTKTMGRPSQRLSEPQDRDASTNRMFDPSTQPPAPELHGHDRGNVLARKNIHFGPSEADSSDKERFAKLKETRGAEPESASIGFHNRDEGTSYVNERNALTALVHEVLGHGWNPVVDSPSRESQEYYGYDSAARNSPWRRELRGAAYYVSNDAELSAAFGNLRKQVYRAYQVDVGDPKVFRSVYNGFMANHGQALDRAAFDGTLSSDAVGLLRGLQALRGYAGNDWEINRRKQEVEALLADENFTMQLVDNQPGKPDSRKRIG